MKKKLYKLITGLGIRGLLNWVPSKIYLSLLWYLKFGYKLNLTNPKSFNEKLQWLKLNNHNVLYTKLVDKIEAKKYISEVLGDDYVIKNLWVGNDPKKIPYEELPNKFVIKCSHGSSCNIIVTDKERIDKKQIEKKLRKWLKMNWYYYCREWPYKNVKPQILIEEYMKDNYTNDLFDYKFFCFSGKVKSVLVCSNRSKKLEETWYDREFNLLDVKEGNHPVNNNLIKPVAYEKMLEIAEKLSYDFPFIRIDFYYMNKKIYFGEFTFFPACGFEQFEPETYNLELGKYIKLTK